MNKIKIANIVSRLEYGGVESIILNYVRNMKNSEMFEFHVITQDINAIGCINQFIDQGIKVHIIPHKRKSIIRNCVEMFRILKREKYHIVHSHMNLLDFYALFLAKLSGVSNRITHSHSALNCDNTFQLIYYKLCRLLNIATANNYLACGYDAGKFFYGEDMLKNDKVMILNNAIDTKKYEYSISHRNYIRNKYGISDDTYLIGHVGRFATVKNHNFIIEAFNEVLNCDENAKLMLIGTGELFNEISEKVSELDLKSKVVFVGNTDEVHKYYSAMDIFILPSFYEGLPVVSIETQCSDLPCVFSENVDVRCKITDRVSFLPIDDSLEQWKNTIVGYRGMSRRKSNINKVKKAGYDIEMETGKLEQMYLELSNSRKEQRILRY